MKNASFQFYIGQFVNALESELEPAEFDQSLTDHLFASVESDDMQSQRIYESEQALNGVLSSVAQSMAHDGLECEFTEQQIAVATATSIMAADPRKSLEADVASPMEEGANVHISRASGVREGTRKHALENYDERDTESIPTKSIAYNVEAIKPDNFVTTMFPFIIFNPSSAGVRVKVEMLYREDNIQRSLSGNVAAYNRVMLTQAAIDPEILRDDSTRLAMSRSAENDSHFVDTAIVPNWSIMNEQQPVTTNYIKFGSKVDLIALSQTPNLLSKGIMNGTDQLDVRNAIDKVAYSVGGDVLEFKLLPITASHFSPAHPGAGTVYTLNMSTTSIVLDATSTARADTAFSEAALQAIATNNWTVQLELGINGTVDIDRGDQEVFHNKLRVYKVFDSSNVELDLTDAAVAPTVALINNATALGYVPYGHRSNTNRRQIGRLLGYSTHTEEYLVPMTSLLSTRRQVGSNRENRDVSLLITSTHYEMANQAVETLEEAAEALRTYSTGNTNVDERPDYLGLGRFYVNPRFIERRLDMPLQINSLTSHDRLSDITAVITLQMRDIAARLYLESGFHSGQRALYPGTVNKPRFVILTDAYLASFLNESHGESLLGDQFDHSIQISENRKVRGKIYMVLGDPTETDGVNPLGTGNTLYAPELVSNLVIDRDNTTSKEITVMQHYRMIMNSNVMGLLHIVGLDDVLGSLVVATTQTGGVNPNSDPYLGLPNGGATQSNSFYW